MKIPVELDAEELALLKSALDSHKYWQLSEEQYRSSGYVNEPGSDDVDDVAEIGRVDVLDAVLSKAEADLERRRKLAEKLVTRKGSGPRG